MRRGFKRAVMGGSPRRSNPRDGVKKGPRILIAPMGHGDWHLLERGPNQGRIPLGWVALGSFLQGPA